MCSRVLEHERVLTIYKVFFREYEREYTHTHTAAHFVVVGNRNSLNDDVSIAQFAQETHTYIRKIRQQRNGIDLRGVSCIFGCVCVYVLEPTFPRYLLNTLHTPTTVHRYGTSLAVGKITLYIRPLIISSGKHVTLWKYLVRTHTQTPTITRVGAHE